MQKDLKLAKVYKEIANKILNLNIMDLAKRLLELTTKNTVKANKARSINELLVVVLKDSEPLTRSEIVAKVAQIRYEDANGEITEEMLDDPEFIAKWDKLSITCKNGVDTSISHSNNNSSFHFNEDFAMWNLQEVSGNKYKLTAKEA